jgi:hypothetical protein
MNQLVFIIVNHVLISLLNGNKENTLNISANQGIIFFQSISRLEYQQNTI